MRRPNSRFIIAAALVILASGLLILNASGFLQPVQDLAMRPVTAIQTWFAVRYSALRDLLASPRDVAALRAEINRLEAENAQLEQDIISLREQAEEAAVLSALLNYARAQPDNRYLAANIIGRDISPFIRSVLIGQGSDAGVATGMPVVTARGLVGRVVEVFASFSRVELITDPSTAVNVRFQNSRTEGILTAELNGDLIVDLIDLNADLSQNELVLTSGLGGKYPANIPIGQVVSIRRRDFDLFQTATIQPSVDFDGLDIVLVITNFTAFRIDTSQP
jgi:rod shape-determining protein MreC